MSLSFGVGSKGLPAEIWQEQEGNKTVDSKKDRSLGMHYGVGGGGAHAEIWQEQVTRNSSQAHKSPQLSTYRDTISLESKTWNVERELISANMGDKF